MELILLICRFYTPDLLTCQSLFVIPKSVLMVPLWSFVDTLRMVKKKKFAAQCAHSQLRSDKATALPFCFSSHTVNKHSFHSPLTPCFRTSVFFLLVISLF